MMGSWTLNEESIGASQQQNIYWFAPSTQLHLQVPRVTMGKGKCVLMVRLRVTLLNVRDLEIKSAAHGTKPQELHPSQDS